MIRAAGMLALASLAAACARGPDPSPAPSAAPAPATVPVADLAPIAIRIPPAVGAVTMRTRRDYEDRAAGTMLRYAGPDSMIADVFVYPGPDLASRCSISCAQDVLRNEASSFEQSFPEMIRLGYVEAAKVTSRGPLMPPDGAAWRLGEHISAAMTRDKQAQRSDFYLFYLPGYRVKIRATYVETPARITALRNFAAELVPALTRK